jgi:hypothetical protein
MPTRLDNSKLTFWRLYSNDRMKLNTSVWSCTERTFTSSWNTSKLDATSHANIHQLIMSAISRAASKLYTHLFNIKENWVSTSFEIYATRLCAVIRFKLTDEGLQMFWRSLCNKCLVTEQVSSFLCSPTRLQYKRFRQTDSELVLKVLNIYLKYCQIFSTWRRQAIFLLTHSET